MLPEIKIGSLSVPSYWLMVTIGFIAMIIMLYKRRDVMNISKATAVISGVLIFIYGIVGAKLLFIIEDWENVVANGVSLSGGMSFYGSVWFVAIMLLLTSRVYGKKSQEYIDYCAPTVLLILAFTRIGCFLVGCCGGIEVSLFSLNMKIPTQIIECAVDILIIDYLLNKKHTMGTVYPKSMVCYSIASFFIEFMRDTPKDVFYMSNGQLFAIATIIMGIIWIKAVKKKGEKYE